MVDAIRVEKVSEINREAEGRFYLSPFAYRADEKLLLEDLSEGGFGRYIELNEFQSEIIKAVNVLLVTNKQILKKYLTRTGVAVEECKLTKELQRLSNNHYLNKMVFQNSDGSIAMMRVYSVGRKGRGYLRFNKIRTRLEGYVASRTAIQVKKLLAANQAMFGIAGNDLSIYTETAKSFWFDKKKTRNTDLVFRALALVNNWESNQSYIIQPLRNDGKDNLKDLIDKLERMDTVIKKAGTIEMKLCKDITVLVVAENSAWMEYYEPVLKKLYFSHFKIAVSYDRLMNSSETIESKIHYIESEPFWKRLLRVR